MQALTLTMIVVVTTFEFLTKGDSWGRWTILPGGSQYVAEILSAVVAAYVIVAGTRNRFELVRGGYWLVLGAILLTVTAGAIANAVEAGTIFAGIRGYLRAIPWFFLPAVYAFTDDQLKQQLRLLLLIGVVQAPLALQQSMTTVSRAERQGWGYTGDWTSGTLMLSPTLSIFVICGICIATGLLARKYLSIWQFVLLFVVLLFPATINETKATFILLPIGLMVVFIVASTPGRKLQNLSASVIVIAMFLVVAVPAYDYMIRENEWQEPIGEMLTDPEALERYLVYKEGIGTTKAVGKGDTIVVALRVAAQDPVHFVLGHGIGNVSDSALGAGFTGEHFRRYGPFTTTSFGRIVLELGLLGLGLILLLLLMIYRDALAVAKQDNRLRSGLSAGWAGVTVIMLLAVPYTDVIPMTSISYLFWYLAGQVAADRMRDGRA